MKYNTLFEDVEYMFKIKLATPISEDQYGYFIDLRIYNRDIIDLLKFGIVPICTDKDYFILKVELNNKSIIKFNGVQIQYLGEEWLDDISLNRIIPKEICLKRYSSKTRKRNRTCYATKLIFTIKQ